LSTEGYYVDNAIQPITFNPDKRCDVMGMV
jgi:hypothetical protein